ncbi:hypothetical protein MICAC_5470028 [Microcystis aeruginosa PCC 9443]|uniref:Uncharacterized protein n=1 Tax=Microcystis aeruginosa PCC 9443 TaxID=1160281 RepID=I4G8E2_MICAE|nr:hypothetical protein MICAC_5470028 [Microcystis aeruginosa PCC 9443]
MAALVESGQDLSDLYAQKTGFFKKPVFYQKKGALLGSV